MLKQGAGRSRKRTTEDECCRWTWLVNSGMMQAWHAAIRGGHLESDTGNNRPQPRKTTPRQPGRCRRRDVNVSTDPERQRNDRGAGERVARVRLANWKAHASPCSLRLGQGRNQHLPAWQYDETFSNSDRAGIKTAARISRRVPEAKLVVSHFFPCHYWDPPMGNPSAYYSHFNVGQNDVFPWMSLLPLMCFSIEVMYCSFLLEFSAKITDT